MSEQQQGFTGALEGATSQLETLQGIINERVMAAFREAGIAVAEFLDDSITLDEFLENLDEEEREYEAARRRDIFIARKREKRRRAKLGY